MFLGTHGQPSFRPASSGRVCPAFIPNEQTYFLRFCFVGLFRWFLCDAGAFSPASSLFEARLSLSPQGQLLRSPFA